MAGTELEAGTAVTIPPEAVRDEVLVRFRPAVGRLRQQSLANSLGGQLRYFRNPSRPVATQTTGGAGTIFEQLAMVRLDATVSLSEALQRFRQQPEVLYAEPNYRLRLADESPGQVLPNDFDFSQLWGLQNIGQADGTPGADISAPLAWQRLTGDKGIVVAVIDTGIDYYHPDLAANIWVNPHEIAGNGLDDGSNGYIDDVQGYDFVSDDGDPMDDHGHGTHVAGTIGAVGNNRIGIAGVCWTVSLMAVKSFDESGNGDVSKAIEGIRYAIENRAHIINASWGNNERSRALEEVIQEAHDAGVVFIAAAGNDNSEAPFYPGAFEHVVAVAATDAKDRRSRFSDFGAYVDVSAPGENIYSTLPNNAYGFYSGTSMATPHVAGVAALVLAQHPEFTPDQIDNLLRNAVDFIVPDKYIGTGRINALSALRIQTPLPTVKLVLPEVIYGDIDIAGAAAGDAFQSYSLEYGLGANPTNWTSFYSSGTAVPKGPLYEKFATPVLGEGPVTFRLTAVNGAGERAVERASVQVSNVHISSPNHSDILRWGERLPIRGTVFGGQRRYQLQYGIGPNPTVWSSEGITATTQGPAAIQDGLLGIWDTSLVASNQFFCLKLIATAADQAVTTFITRLIYLDSHLKPGWPQYLPITGTLSAEAWRDMTVADLDNDGLSEIVLVDQGNNDGKPAKLMVYSHEGALLWSKELSSGFPYSDIPVIGDVDGDGRQEIFVDAGSDGMLFAFRYDGSPLPGKWPVHLEAAGLGKVIADLDGNGWKEIIGLSAGTVTRGGTDHRQLVVFDAEGGLIRKWELPACAAELDAPRLIPTVGNLDGEPDLEIVAPSGCDTVAAFKLTKASGPLWSAGTYGTLVSSPVIGDLNRDDTNEVVIAAFDMEGGKRGGVYAFDHAGRRLPGWPVLVEESFSAAPALGDIDGDGELEICLPSWKSGLLHLLRRDGFEVEGWPVNSEGRSSFNTSAALGDVDSDGRADIVLSSPGFMSQVMNDGDLTKAGGVKAWKANGQPISFTGNDQLTPLVMESFGGAWLKGPALTLADIDHNGKLDIIAASIQDRTYLPSGQKSSRKNRSSIYVWELDTPYDSARFPWPSVQRNAEHTGYYPTPPRVNQPPVITPIFNQVIPPGGTFFPIDLDRYVEDPDDAPNKISWSVSGQRDLIVTITTNRVLIVRPASGAWTGREAIRLVARDRGGLQSETTVTFEIRTGYQAPLAVNDQAATLEDTPVEIDVLANDRDPAGDALSVASFSKPRFGTIVRTGLGRLRYEPTADANGLDSFTYVLSNAKGGVVIAEVVVQVAPVNDPPVALPDHVVLDEDTPGDIPVLANDLDPDDDPLTLLDFTQPENGTARETAPGVLAYSPSADYYGADTLTYRMSDGHGEPVSGTVKIIIKPINDPPLADEQTLVLNRNASQSITFSATDPDDTDLTFSVIDGPKQGTLWAYPKVATYYPTNHFTGQDRFTYRAHDGKDAGPIVTVHLTVLDANNPPEVQDRAMVTKVDQAAVIHLSASDIDDDPLTYVILTLPEKGTLSGSETNYVYQPAPGFIGSDGFTFQVSDGRDTSRVAKFSLKVTDQNTAPTAEDFLVNVLLNTPTNIVLRATDPESNPLNFHVVTKPLNGKLSGKGEVLLYSPNPFFVGSDRFTFSADDGEFDSNVGTVTIAVDAANHRPGSTNQQLRLVHNTSLAFQLTVVDLDGDRLSCPILKGPRNGRLAGLGTQFVYTPKLGFTGTDTFTYKAWDGQTYSLEATVSIDVTLDAPVTEIAFKSVSFLGDGHLKLLLSVPPGQRVEVLASTNLVDWSPLPVSVSAGEAVSVLDTEAPNHSRRFYQARQVE